MHMPAANAWTEHREFAVGINLPNRFQITEIDISPAIENDAAGR